MDRVFVKTSGNRLWTEFINDKLNAEFNFIEYDSDWNPIIYDSGRKFYVKITSDALYWDDHSTNMRYKFGNGKWELTPQREIPKEGKLLL